MSDALDGGDAGYKCKTINTNTATIQGTEGTNEDESTPQIQEAANTASTQHSQQINISDEDEDEDGGHIDSDTEVKEVMEGMKNWTKSPPFPYDAEYFFPKEPRTKTRIAEQAFRRRRMLEEALGKTPLGKRRVQVPANYEEATRVPAPHGLVPMAQVVEGTGGKGQGDLGDRAMVMENDKEGK